MTIERAYKILDIFSPIRYGNIFDYYCYFSGAVVNKKQDPPLPADQITDEEILFVEFLNKHDHNTKHVDNSPEEFKDLIIELIGEFNQIRREDKINKILK